MFLSNLIVTLDTSYKLEVSNQSTRQVYTRKESGLVGFFGVLYRV